LYTSVKPFPKPLSQRRFLPCSKTNQKKLEESIKTLKKKKQIKEKLVKRIELTSPYLGTHLTAIIFCSELNGNSWSLVNFSLTPYMPCCKRIILFFTFYQVLIRTLKKKKDVHNNKRKDFYLFVYL
jgi:hypothetical protein